MRKEKKHFKDHDSRQSLKCVSGSPQKNREETNSHFYLHGNPWYVSDKVPASLTKQKSTNNQISSCFLRLNLSYKDRQDMFPVCGM